MVLTPLVRPLDELIHDAHAAVASLQSAATAKRARLRLVSLSAHLVRVAHEIETTLQARPELGR